MNRPTVVREHDRVPPATVERLAAAGVATVGEAAGRHGLMQPYLRPVVDDARIAGTAVTALCHPGDNLMIHVAVEQCRPGDILVVTTTGTSTDGMLGELLAVSLRAREVRGAVIDAGVRDVAELREMAFPVWSRARSAHGTVKQTAGAVNVPVVCAGIQVHAGDVIVADDDGVVCVPGPQAEDVAAAAEARMQREASVRDRLAAGELGLDIYGLRELLEKQGVEYVESTDTERG